MGEQYIPGCTVAGVIGKADRGSIVVALAHIAACARSQQQVDHLPLIGPRGLVQGPSPPGPPPCPTPGPPAPLTRKGAWEDQEGAHDEGKTGLKAQAKFGLLSIFRGPGFAAQWKFTKKWGGLGGPKRAT